MSLGTRLSRRQKEALLRSQGGSLYDRRKKGGGREEKRETEKREGSISLSPNLSPFFPFSKPAKEA